MRISSARDASDRIGGGLSRVTLTKADDLHFMHEIPVLPAPSNMTIACPGGCPTLPPLPTLTPTATPPPTATPGPCVGDCRGTGVVTIADLVTAVRIVLGDQPLATCPFLDANQDGRASIEEMVRAVRNALDGCPARG